MCRYAVASACLWLSAASAMPPVSEGEVRASRIVHPLPERPQTRQGNVLNSAEMLNRVVVVEAAGNHAALLDVGKFEVIHQFAYRNGLQGEPQFTPDGRYVFLASRDGWIGKFDLQYLQLVAEVRAGTELQNMAVSGDGKFLAVATVEPHALVLLDTDLNLRNFHVARSKDGRASSRVLSVSTAASRQSFVVALADVPEVWEISTNPAADDVATGMVHDFQYKEGAFIPGFLNPRRTTLAQPLSDLLLTPDGNELVGVDRRSGKAVVVHLDVRKQIAEFDLPGPANLRAGIAWRARPSARMALPKTEDGLVSIIDLKEWKAIKSLQMPGTGILAHSAESNYFLWTGSTVSAVRDTLAVFDKRTLESVVELTPAPGKRLAHVAFTANGRHLMVSVSESRDNGGAIIIFDASTFKELGRIPMERPLAVYGMHNFRTDPARGLKYSRE